MCYDNRMSKEKSAWSRLAAKWWRWPIRKLRSTINAPAIVFPLVRTMAAKVGDEKSGDIRISLLCPTRRRPDKMARMWKSAIKTAANPESVEVVFAMDNDDVAGMFGLRLAAEVRAEQVRAIVGKRMTLSKCWNAAAKVAKGEIFMLCGDDIIFRSQGWDAVAAEKISAFNDRIAFVHGRDGIYDEKLGTHGFVHRDWVRVVGYFSPPFFSSDHCDTWLQEIAERIGRKVYTPDIYTQHMHFTHGKSALDKTYYERIERHRDDNNEEIWKQTEHMRIAAAEKLQAHIANHAKSNIA